jgi:hypothetical protein
MTDTTMVLAWGLMIFTVWWSASLAIEAWRRRPPAIYDPNKGKWVAKRGVRR